MQKSEEPSLGCLKSPYKSQKLYKAVVELGHRARRTREEWSLQEPPATTTTTTTAGKNGKIQRIEVAKDSANNPKAERLEKIRRFCLKIYIWSQGQDQLRGLALTTIHSLLIRGEDGIDSARDAISPFFLG